MPTPLEAIRLKLALAVGEHAAFDGWTQKAVGAAADQLGVDRAQARLAFPKRHAEMGGAYIQGGDAAVEARLTPDLVARQRPAPAHPDALPGTPALPGALNLLPTRSCY